MQQIASQHKNLSQQAKEMPEMCNLHNRTKTSKVQVEPTEKENPNFMQNEKTLTAWDYFSVPQPDGQGRIEYRVGQLHGHEVTQEKVSWHENNGNRIITKAHKGAYDVDGIEIHGTGSCFLLTGWKTLNFENLDIQNLVNQ